MHALTRFQEIEVIPASPSLGAEIRGVDLSRPLDDRVLAEIRRALLDHCVIFFREQDLTPETQLAFARRFGDIHLHPFMKGLEAFPEVLPIVKAETDNRNFGGVWHTDQMFAPQPAMGTLLYALEVPASGGDTLFANMYLAYEALSGGLRARIDGRAASNSSLKADAGATREDRRASDGRDDAPEVLMAEHPVVRTHPETGRRALYVNVGHTERFKDMSVDESAPILAFLFEHLKRPEFSCCFRWTPGAMALWDNRCAQHYPVNDYHGHKRVMHRITLKGDRPE